MENLKRSLNLIAGSFAMGAVALVGVLSAVDLGDAESPDLADAGALTAAFFGVIGLLVALQYWSRSGERTTATSANVQIGFIVRVAIAEMGLLIGILAQVMTGSKLPPLLGLALFLVSLLLLVLGLRRITE